MAAIKFKTFSPAEGDTIELIADWYFNEWNIPRQVTIEKLKSVNEFINSFTLGKT
jgi:hypothetical protein